MWTILKRRATDRLSIAAVSRPLKVAFRPSPETEHLGYFFADLDRELAGTSSDRIRYVSRSHPLGQVDVLLSTAHGGDLAAYLTDLRGELPAHALIGVWFWDNHIAQVNNLRSAIGADLAIASHAYCADGLFNSVSVVGGICPPCCAQWGAAELTEFFGAANPSAPRSDKLLVNYVDYAFSWRSRLLKQLKDEMPEAAVLTMPPEDRSRYFRKSNAERFQEWLGYQTTLILPVAQDLSTRVFDALAAGLIPIVPRAVLDFDQVISPADQSNLGITRIDDLSIEAIRAAWLEATSRFDAMGIDGIRRRHRHVLDHHLLRHRVEVLVRIATAVLDGHAVPDWSSEPYPMGLMLKPA